MLRADSEKKGLAGSVNKTPGARLEQSFAYPARVFFRELSKIGTTDHSRAQLLIGLLKQGLIRITGRHRYLSFSEIRFALVLGGEWVAKSRGLYKGDVQMHGTLALKRCCDHARSTESA